MSNTRRPGKPGKTCTMLNEFEAENLGKEFKKKKSNLETGRFLEHLSHFLRELSSSQLKESTFEEISKLRRRMEG